LSSIGGAVATITVAAATTTDTVNSLASHGYRQNDRPTKNKQTLENKQRAA
jgi:hypothetical protein